ncbi:MAG: hypothetical protein ACLPXM_11245 [Terriglobales bacterium]
MRRLLFCVLALFLVSSTLTCFSQQDDVRQFTVFGAYTYLATRSLNLAQRGFDGDLGYNYRSWLSLGFDFGYYDGHNTIFPNELSPAGQALLGHLLPPGGTFPPGFGLPFNIQTFTYEAGPQLNYRHFKKVTLFVRPALGALHATAGLQKDFLAANPMLGAGVCELLNGCSKNDTVPFYGFGGGVSWEITPHFGLRVTGDFAHYDFFSSLLNGGRNSVRVSIGPKFSFGKNILEK